jgi:hypothetical protein
VDVSLREYTERWEADHSHVHELETEARKTALENLDQRLNVIQNRMEEMQRIELSFVTQTQYESAHQRLIDEMHAAVQRHIDTVEIQWREQAKRDESITTRLAALERGGTRANGIVIGVMAMISIFGGAIIGLLIRAFGI